MASAESYWSALDAGGTMTDSVIVDPSGRYLPGKALTNKRDESLSFVAAMRDAASFGGRRLEEVLPHTRSIVYAGTILLNTIPRITN
jgi:acetone carboxylase beta subunit